MKLSNGKLCGALILVAAPAPAVTIDTRIVQTGGHVGSIIHFSIQAQLSPGSAGLALFGANLRLNPSGGAVEVDLCDQGNAFELLAPVEMATFDRLAGPGPGSGYSNWGLTNPGDNAPTYSGYSGTCDGNGGLLQIGGAQNTIGNTPGGAPYPIGAVVQNIGNGGYVHVAVGFIDATMLVHGQWELCLDTVFATTINSGQVSAPFAVTEATAGANACLTITGVQIPCLSADVNCDGNVNAGDLAVVVNNANFLKAAWPAAGGAPCDRANVNGDANVNAGDLAAIVGPNWLSSTGPCICQTVTPGVGGCPDPGGRSADESLNAKRMATPGEIEASSKAGPPLCPNPDVNCDGSINAGDMAVVVNPANFLKAAWPSSTGALCDRANVNGDAAVGAGDLAAIVVPNAWLTSHGACTCVTNTPGVGGCPTP